MPEPRSLSGSARLKVDAALKATIEAELTRQKLNPEVLGGGGDGGGGGGPQPFSRGVIFSKTDPFSRGIIFSKLAGMERPDEAVILEQTAAMDEVAFHAFADRLIKMKQAKNIGGGSR